ncbi:MAG: RND family transporter [Thermosipho sp. (in: Bacteria)]|nr:RND family transporter [Thermosipho sp. (in: thermotogales)]
MEKYVEFFIKYKKILLIFLIVLNIFFLLGIFRIRINTDFTLFMSRNSKYVAILNKMEQTFLSNDQVNVIFELNFDPLSLEGLKKIKEIEKKIKSIDGILDVVSPLPDEIPVGFRKINVSEITEENYSYAINFIKMMNIENIVEKNGKYYLMLYVIPRKGEIVKKLDSVLSDIPHYFAGTKYLEEKIFDYMLFIIFTLPPLAILTVFFVFKWRLGDFKATFFSVFPAGIGALWTMGFIGWVKGEISLLTILAPIFTIVMGSADGLHFVSHYIDLKKGRDKIQALTETFRSTGIAMILTTVTTVAGFLSLAFISSQSLSELSIISSIGITFAGIATWLFLPIILLHDDIKTVERESKISKLFESLLGKKSIIISIILFTAFFPGIFMINNEFYMIDMYKDYTEVKKNIDISQDIFGMSIPVFAYFETTFDPIEPEFANKVLRIEEEFRKNGNKVVSFYDVLTSINEKILKREGYPENSAQVKILLNLVPNIYTNFLNRDKKAGRIIIFPKEINRTQLESIERLVEDPIKVTGIPYVMKEMNEKIVPQQIKSLLFAVLMVFVIVFIRFKDLKKAFISIFPISLTLVVLFGFMGYSGIKLSIITATMGSIVVGVGIDYAIHFIENFGYNLKKYSEVDLVLTKTYETTSKPILANALGLAIGLSVLILSPFKIHEYLVMIMWVTMTSSSFLSLSLLPTLLSKIYKSN